MDGEPNMSLWRQLFKSSSDSERSASRKNIEHAGQMLARMFLEHDFGMDLQALAESQHGLQPEVRALLPSAIRTFAAWRCKCAAVQAFGVEHSKDLVTSAELVLTRIAPQIGLPPSQGGLLTYAFEHLDRCAEVASKPVEGRSLPVELPAAIFFLQRQAGSPFHGKEDFAGQEWELGAVLEELRPVIDPAVATYMRVIKESSSPLP